MINAQKLKALNEMTELVLNSTGSSPIYSCLLCISDTKKRTTYNRAIGDFKGSEDPINHSVQFRIGSITKPFTAAIILQLMEEGKFMLTDRYMDLINDNTKSVLKNILQIEITDCSNYITVEHLLTHQSGLLDYYSDDERFVEYVRKFPEKSWNWKLVMKKYFEFGLNLKGNFRPGEGFHYADTNYLLLAVLIEDICNLAFAEVLEQRILKPLGLNDTYLEFYQDKKGPNPIIFPYHGTTHLKGINTSFDWGGGGLVSTLADLNTFLPALILGHLFKLPSTLHKLLSYTDPSKNEASSSDKTKYCFGLQQKNIYGLNLIGHTSAYGAMTFYEPMNKINVTVSVNQVAGVHKAEWLMRKAIEVYLS